MLKGGAEGDLVKGRYQPTTSICGLRCTAETAKFAPRARMSVLYADSSQHLLHCNADSDRCERSTKDKTSHPSDATFGLAVALFECTAMPSVVCRGAAAWYAHSGTRRITLCTLLVGGGYAHRGARQIASRGVIRRTMQQLKFTRIQSPYKINFVHIKSRTLFLLKPSHIVF